MHGAHLFHAVEAGKGKVVFSSRDIPNEIMDFLIVSEAALKESPALGKALTEAWFDVFTNLASWTIGRLLVDAKPYPEASRVFVADSGTLYMGEYQGKPPPPSGVILIIE